MRPLAILFLIALSAESQALTTLLGFRVASQSQNGRVELVAPTNRYATKQLSQTLSYRANNVRPGLGLSLEVTQTQPDYSNTLIRDINGKETPLSETALTRNELSASLSTSYAVGPLSFNLSGQASLNPSPYSGQSVTSQTSYGFFHQTSVVGLTLNYAKLNQPESYFTNLDFSARKRPTTVNALSSMAHYEQILSSQLKVRTEIGVGQRIEDRPIHWSASSELGYALSDTVFSRIRLTYARELESQALKDERGYFRNMSARASITTEPLYDLLVSLSYTLLFEKESNPVNERVVQVASDQYGLGIRYSSGPMQLDFGGSYSVTNAETNDYQLSGGVTWEI